MICVAFKSKLERSLSDSSGPPFLLCQLKPGHELFIQRCSVPGAMCSPAPVARTQMGSAIHKLNFVIASQGDLGIVLHNSEKLPYLTNISDLCQCSSGRGYIVILFGSNFLRVLSESIKYSLNNLRHIPELIYNIKTIANIYQSLIIIEEL